MIAADASASLRHDVQLYDRLVGLPDPQLTVLHPFGATATDRVSEDVLDVETLHTLAPGASLVVVDAHTSTPTPSAAAADQIDRFPARRSRPACLPPAPGRSPTWRTTPTTTPAYPTVRTVSGRTQIVIGGGTSLGAPSWAAIAALAGQRAGRRLGFLNAALYRLAGSGGYAQAFRDVTRGDNTARVRQGGQVVTVTGYPAGPGWDAVTGWGSPLASGLADLLPRYQQPDDGAGV